MPDKANSSIVRRLKRLSDWFDDPILWFGDRAGAVVRVERSEPRERHFSRARLPRISLRSIRAT